MSHEMAKLRLRTFRRQYGEISYNELIELGEFSDRMCEDMSVQDPAWMRFQKERTAYFKYAEALNDAENLGLRRHLFSRDVMVSFRGGKLTFELPVWVPRWEKEKHLQPNHWLNYTHAQLRQQGYSLADLQDLEVVLA